MYRKTLLLFLYITLLLSLNLFGKSKTDQPNIILILADDMGWGDTGFNNCTDIPTPNLDNLAKNGIIFEQGYAAHPYCSPSRAGLLTGRYPYRFGHDNNIPYTNAKPTDGLPLSETLISNVLKNNGYTTACIGKWHLGDCEPFWPVNRGFDYWYGFASGGRDYWGYDDVKRKEKDKIRRNGEVVPLEEQGYLTDDFTKETIRFIEKNKDNRFFIYLAYNAPHAPIHATQEYLSMTDHIESGARSAYGAMVSGMDKGIGDVKDKLKELGLLENTIVIFYSDNGGHHHGASNHPYRGYKGNLFEGGIREPFMIHWPEKIKKGTVYKHPIIAYDLFPTILNATGIENYKNLNLDGTDLFPYLKDKKGTPHKTLFWRYSGGLGYAVLDGKYKLVKEHNLPVYLFDMEQDSFEQFNLAKKMPSKVEELQKLYHKWNSDMVPPKWEDPHIENVIKTQNKKDYFIQKACEGERS